MTGPLIAAIVWRRPALRDAAACAETSGRRVSVRGARPSGVASRATELQAQDANRLVRNREVPYHIVWSITAHTIYRTISDPLSHK